MSLPERKQEQYSKAMAKKITRKTKPTLTLHGLLGALSFWGTATRAFLFAFLAVAVYLVALTEADTVAGADTETMKFIYVMASFVLLDFGYVLISRAYTLPRVLDVLALYVADVLLGLIYIVPKVVVDSGVTLKTDPLLYVIFIPIVVLSLRMLLGILFGRRTS